MTSRSFIVIILFLSACACSDTSGNNADEGCELGKTMCFPEDNTYASLDPVNDSSVFECSSQASYIDAGTSPGFFAGGCPGPMSLLGTWSGENGESGRLYKWTEYLSQGPSDSPDVLVGTVTNIFALPNGIAMIHWDKNETLSALNGKMSVELITGWGAYPDKVLPGDYGWINGTIFNMAERFQVPFIHIYYRQVRQITGTVDDGIEHGTLHFWELLLPPEDMVNAPTLYRQLKEHIDHYWTVVTDPSTAGQYGESIEVQSPLKELMDGVYYMKLQDNQQIPTVPSTYWGPNTKYHGNNSND